MNILTRKWAWRRRSPKARCRCRRPACVQLASTDVPTVTLILIGVLHTFANHHFVLCVCCDSEEWLIAIGTASELPYFYAEIVDPSFVIQAQHFLLPAFRSFVFRIRVALICLSFFFFCESKEWLVRFYAFSSYELYHFQRSTANTKMELPQYWPDGRRALKSLVVRRGWDHMVQLISEQFICLLAFRCFWSIHMVEVAIC